MNEVKKSQIEKSEPVQPASTPVEGAKKKSGQLAEILGIEAVIVVVILLSIIMILNFFNIIPLSTNMPKIFGWLPHKSMNVSDVAQSTPGTSTEEQMEAGQLAPTAVPTYLITCPVSPGFCPQAKSVYNKTTRRVEGLGFMNLTEGLAIYSVFDGTLSSNTQKVDGADLTTITLTGENGFVATYRFIGLPQREKGASRSAVKQAEIIGIVDGGALELFDFTSQKYSLSLTIVNSENNQNITVRPREDGAALDLD